MATSSPCTPLKQCYGTTDFVQLLNDFSKKWDLRLKLPQNGDSPRGRHSQNQAVAEECANKCIDRIKYLWYKDKAALFSTLGAFERHAAALNCRWDPKPNAEAMSSRSFEPFDISPASSQQRDLLGNLLCFLEPPFQETYQRTISDFKSYHRSSYSTSRRPTISSIMRPNSEIKSESKKISLLVTGLDSIDIHSNNYRTDSAPKEYTSLPEEKFSSEAPLTPALENRPSMGTQQYFPTSCSHEGVNSELSFDLIDHYDAHGTQLHERFCAGSEGLDSMRGHLSKESFGIKTYTSKHSLQSSAVKTFGNSQTTYDNTLGGDGEAIACDNIRKANTLDSYTIPVLPCVNPDRQSNKALLESRPVTDAFEERFKKIFRKSLFTIHGRFYRNNNDK